MRNKTNFLGIPFFISGILLILVLGCKKDETKPDYAILISYTYSGTYTVSGLGSVTGSSTLARVNDAMVNLTMSISGQNISLNGISVTSPSSNAYTLTYTDSSGSFSGTVQGKTLTYTMTSGTDIVTFNGTR